MFQKVKGNEGQEEKKHEPWRIDTVINPRNDSIQILALPEGEPFILPEDITAEERKDYPMRIMRNTLEEKFLDEINRRMIPHIPHSLIGHDIEAKARFTIMLKMKDSEGDIKTRKIHTNLIPLRLNSGVYIRRFFQTIRDEWIGVLNKYTKYAVGERGT